jgi:hypothetical protein
MTVFEEGHGPFRVYPIEWVSAVFIAGMQVG